MTSRLRIRCADSMVRWSGAENMLDRRFKLLAMILTCAVLRAGTAVAAPVAVRHTEGLIHGFLVLSTMESVPVAYGDLIQVSRNDRVTSHIVFRFKDGSVHDETTVFSQRGSFRLLNYHLEQKGPAFHYPMDMSIDCSSGQVTVRYMDDNKEKVASNRMRLPPDLANGLIFTLLQNVPPGESLPTVSMVAATPKPRLVKLAITQQGEEPFSIGGSERTAVHYVIKVKIGGVAGAVAPIVGKEPPDIHAWILGGDAPVLVKSEGPLSVGGPTWRIEMASPVWPRPTSENSGKQQQHN
jgi:hypothetical protein